MGHIGTSGGHDRAPQRGGENLNVPPPPLWCGWEGGKHPPLCGDNLLGWDEAITPTPAVVPWPGSCGSNQDL